jgi:hypothetical protein
MQIKYDLVTVLYVSCNIYYEYLYVALKAERLLRPKNFISASLNVAANT